MLTGAKGTEDCHMFLQHARYNLCFKRMFSTGELILEKIKAQEKQTRRDVTSWTEIELEWKFSAVLQLAG